MMRVANSFLSFFRIFTFKCCLCLIQVNGDKDREAVLVDLTTAMELLLSSGAGPITTAPPVEDIPAAEPAEPEVPREEEESTQPTEQPSESAALFADVPVCSNA